MYRAKQLRTGTLGTSCSHQRPLKLLTAAMKTSAISLPKATPRMCTNADIMRGVTVVPEISEKCLADGGGDVHIGNGRFGTCSRMIFKECFDVCVKTFTSDSSIESIRHEASILLTLNSSPYIPHCFGICSTRRALVMSNVSVKQQQVSLYSALYSTNEIKLNPKTWMQILIQICDGLSYMHKLSILHNDLKVDNVVLGTTLLECIRPCIVDFGKACKEKHAKKYCLTEEQKVIYIKEHTQVAPDLRDGLVLQSTQSDIYSLGRIMKKMNSIVIKSTELAHVIKECLSYHAHDRPSLETISLNVE